MKIFNTLSCFLLFLPAFAQVHNTEELKNTFNQKLSQKAVTFEENKGQMKDQHWKPRPDVLFNGSSQGMNYYIRDNGMSYQLSRIESWKTDEHDKMPGKEKRKVPNRMGTYRVDVQWTNANNNYTVEKGKELPGYNNYYNVPEGVEPALFVKQYESVTLKNLWRGIDLQYYGNEGLLETDWLVAPGADYRQIQFEIKGAEVSVNNEGCLVMKTPFGEIREGTLKVYQNNELLQAKWVVSQPRKNSPAKISFDVPEHNPTLAMRIDPLTRVWGTYYGGNIDDMGYSCATDSGNVYLAGSTTSTSLASGGHQNLIGGNYDAFLVKFSSSGIRHWATYYGGSGEDRAFTCISDGSNGLYLGGWTNSTSNIASIGYQNALGGLRDAFVVKFNSNGVRQWGSYYGGTNNDYGYSFALDSIGNLYFAGNTSSTSGIALNGYQNVFQGNTDAFLVKFNANGGRNWATYYGGTDFDAGSWCATDTNGNIFLSGLTNSPTNIAVNGFQNTFGGNYDAYLAKFDSNGAIQWATYYGGSNYDDAKSCATDGSGNVYMAGITSSANDIAFQGYQNTYNGNTDGFLVKFSNDGIRRWGTYYGGSGQDNCFGLCINNVGSAYLTGSTLSNLERASDGHQNNLGGNSDAFLAKFTTNGVFQWRTYYGGEENDFGRSCSVDYKDNIFIAGYTASSRLIAYKGHQNVFIGSNDAFLTNFRESSIYGYLWHDLNNNCFRDSTDLGIVNGIRLTIQPGNYIVESGVGFWSIDSLPIGSYQVTVDTTNKNWTLTCPVTQTFSIVNPDEITEAPSFGFESKYPCPKPNVSIIMPRMRRGFGNQLIYVQCCNNNPASSIMSNAYCVVKLDSLISVQSASLGYFSLGNSSYRVDLGSIYPGQCVNFTMNASIGLGAVNEQTLCISAELFPQANCVFDTINTPAPSNIPCSSPYDDSHLRIKSWCNNDSVYFLVTNDGEDMACSTRVRLYVDAFYRLNDSVFLVSGASKLFVYAGDGKTWRMEADQHLFYRGQSRPSASVERCGDLTGWTPGIINTMPQDDADPVIDIYCGQVTAPHDPNDKTGFPLGIGRTYSIPQNQNIEYLIRFQNIGTDIAENVIIRDTLSPHLDIFSVSSGVSSHPFEFRMYGPRVLEWTFRDIMLPDSNSNEIASHGFVKFEVKQVPDLPYGTVINNKAAIYFDFEDPVITNTYFHTVSAPQSLPIATEILNAEENISLKVVPNPFSQSATIEIEGLENYNNLSFEMFNVFGQEVKSIRLIDDSRFEIMRDNLAGGIYFFQLKQNDRIVGNGKMIVN